MPKNGDEKPIESGASQKNFEYISIANTSPVYFPSYNIVNRTF